jgi:hypothetical protein
MTYDSANYEREMTKRVVVTGVFAMVAICGAIVAMRDCQLAADNAMAECVKHHSPAECAIALRQGAR